VRHRPQYLGAIRERVKIWWAVTPRADAIVVLGCALHGGRPNPALLRRVECGVSLLAGGAAPLLLLAGGGFGVRAEAEVMREIALTRGAPDAALLLEPRSRNTYENAVEAARLLRERGAATVILVSDRHHLPRARLQFRRAGLAVVATRHPPGRGLRRELPHYLREALAWALTLGRMLCDAINRRERRGA
jgi:uncharacterized SAM-binding protein YcdF (DUF218 family)